MTIKLQMGRAGSDTGDCNSLRIIIIIPLGKNVLIQQNRLSFVNQ